MPKFNKNQYSLLQAYSFYKSLVESPVSYKEYKLILDLWGEKVVAALLNGEDVRLHNGLSVLQIRKVFDTTYVDFKATKEKGRVIKRSNATSNFYRAKIRWKRHYTKINSSSWAFMPTRKFSRELSQVMQSYLGHTRFLEKAKITIKT